MRLVAAHATRSELSRLFGRIAVYGSCWQWSGANVRGYGHIRFRGKNRSCHRLAYMLFVGEIPQGFQIDHLCRNPSCVNPAHLEAVTPRVNVLRGKTVTAANAAKTHCKYGHEFTTENTQRIPTGRRCRECRNKWKRDQRRRRGIRIIVGEDRCRAVLTNEQARQIFVRALSGERTSDLAAVFGVSKNIVSAVKHRRGYKAITEPLATGLVA